MGLDRLDQVCLSLDEMLMVLKDFKLIPVDILDSIACEVM
jgi:hypothetical protein